MVGDAEPLNAPDPATRVAGLAGQVILPLTWRNIRKKMQAIFFILLIPFVLLSCDTFDKMKEMGFESLEKIDSSFAPHYGTKHFR